jgi:hypothetical protein
MRASSRAVLSDGEGSPSSAAFLMSLAAFQIPIKASTSRRTLSSSDCLRDRRTVRRAPAAAIAANRRLKHWTMSLNTEPTVWLRADGSSGHQIVSLDPGSFSSGSLRFSTPVRPGV